MVIRAGEFPSLMRRGVGVTRRRSAPFDPLDLPNRHFGFEATAADLVKTGGGAPVNLDTLQSASDLGGVNDATSVGTNTFLTNQLNGHAAVRVSAGASWTVPHTPGTTLSFFAVMRHRSGADTKEVYKASSRYWLYSRYSGGGTPRLYVGNTSFAGGGVAVPDDEWFVVSCRYDAAADARVWQESIYERKAGAAVNITSPPAASSVVLFNGGDFDWCEAWAFDGLSDANHTSMRDHLYSKYSFTSLRQYNIARAYVDTSLAPITDGTYNPAARDGSGTPGPEGERCYQTVAAAAAAVRDDLSNVSMGGFVWGDVVVRSGLHLFASGGTAFGWLIGSKKIRLRPYGEVGSAERVSLACDPSDPPVSAAGTGTMIGVNNTGGLWLDGRESLRVVGPYALGDHPVADEELTIWASAGASGAGVYAYRTAFYQTSHTCLKSGGDEDTPTTNFREVKECKLLGGGRGNREHGSYDKAPITVPHWFVGNLVVGISGWANHLYNWVWGWHHHCNLIIHCGHAQPSGQGGGGMIVSGPSANSNRVTSNLIGRCRHGNGITIWQTGDGTLDGVTGGTCNQYLYNNLAHDNLDSDIIRTVYNEATTGANNAGNNHTGVAILYGSWYPSAGAGDTTGDPVYAVTGAKPVWPWQFRLRDTSPCHNTGRNLHTALSGLPGATGLQVGLDHTLAGGPNWWPRLVSTSLWNKHCWAGGLSSSSSALIEEENMQLKLTPSTSTCYADYAGHALVSGVDQVAKWIDDESPRHRYPSHPTAGGTLRSNGLEMGAGKFYYLAPPIWVLGTVEKHTTYLIFRRAAGEQFVIYGSETVAEFPGKGIGTDSSAALMYLTTGNKFRINHSDPAQTAHYHEVDFTGSAAANGLILLRARFDGTNWKLAATNMAEVTVTAFGGGGGSQNGGWGLAFMTFLGAEGVSQWTNSNCRFVGIRSTFTDAVAGGGAEDAAILAEINSTFGVGL